MASHERIAELMTEAHERKLMLREKGAKEYARSEDALANFRRVGQILDIDPRKVLLVYAFKHLDGIIAHCDGHELQRDSIDGRVDDIEVYMSLFRGFIDDERRANTHTPEIDDDLPF